MSRDRLPHLSTAEDLLRGFRDGRKVEDRDEFHLVAVRARDWETDDRPFGFSQLGRVLVDSVAYCVVGPRAPIRCGTMEDAMIPYWGPLRLFEGLAKRAGELLPEAVKQTWPSQPSESIDAWLTLLWMEEAPQGSIGFDHTSATATTDERLRWSGNWPAPFTSSARLVQEFLLDPHPRRSIGEIPPLNVESGDWVKVGKAAEIEGHCDTGRIRSAAREMNSAAGVDRDGRMWRRRYDEPRAHRWYFVPSLGRS